MRKFAFTLVATATVGAAAVLAWHVATGDTVPAAVPAQSYFGLSPTRPEGGRFIPAERLGNSDYCGHCHTEIFHQWNASAHHFSSFNNPVYRRVVEETVDRKGPETMKFCAGCHDPLPLLGGEMPLDDLNQWSANAGITCLACHRITEVHGANGAYTVGAPTLHPFAFSDHPALQTVHRLFLKLTPMLHRQALSKPLYSSPEYCASCHTLISPRELNATGDITLQSEYSSWAHSRFAVHSGLAPDSGRKACVDCHMPLVSSKDPAAKNGLIRSHRFVGGNTATPTFNRDDQQTRAVEDFLRSEKIAIRCVGGRINAGAPVTSCDTLQARPGDEVEIEFEVENHGVGHGFPGGTVDSNEAWVEIVVTDASGAVLYRSGALDEAGEVDRSARFFRTVFVDRNGHPTDRRRTVSDAVAVAGTSVIPPNAIRVLRYRFRIPSSARLPAKATASVKWRKFSPGFTRWVFDDRSHPPLPITVLDEAAFAIKAVDTSRAESGEGQSVVSGSAQEFDRAVAREEQR